MRRINTPQQRPATTHPKFLQFALRSWVALGSQSFDHIHDLLNAACHLGSKAELGKIVVPVPKKQGDQYAKHKEAQATCAQASPVVSHHTERRDNRTQCTHDTAYPSMAAFSLRSVRISWINGSLSHSLPALARVM